MRVDDPERAPAAITPDQRTAAKILGFLYVIQMAVTVFGQSFVRDRLIVAGDAEKTAQNILAHEGLFRLSIVGDLFVYIGVIVLVWAFYVVVLPVNRNLALLAAFFRLAETAILCVATGGSLVVLKVLSGSGDLQAFSASQLHAFAKLALGVQGIGMNIASSFSAWDPRSSRICC